MNLDNAIEELKGVGPKLQTALNRLGIYTIRDLVLYFPRDYEFPNSSYNTIVPENAGRCIVEAEVIGIEKDVRSKTGKLISTIIFKHNSKKLYGKWFNQPYIKNNFKIGEKYRLIGKVEMFRNYLTITNAKPIANNVNMPEVIPKYSLNKDITSAAISKLIVQGLSKVTVMENLPENLLGKYSLCSLNDAISNIHYPSNKKRLEEAKTRLKFQELFVYSLKILLLKKQKRSYTDGIAYKISDKLTILKEHLPFQLTNAQSKVMREILLDEKRVSPMNRLLQGDVGSGKTIIALISMFNVVMNGFQCAFMVPTEILAIQHFEEAKKLLNEFNVKIELLSGSISAKNKKLLKEQLKNGDIDIIIGTHALIEDDVEFKNLGMVVTDEQHRFGVYQRSKLLNKGNNIDVLVMSATPIPRTLALYLYGDLDISIIDELPPGRKKIETIHVTEQKKDDAYSLVLEQIQQGRQAYIVCPLIEENDDSNLKSIESLYKDLKKSYFKDIEIGLLHGKLTSMEKDTIMSDFKEQKIKVLISTTVIEVGVNVPNATVMVIENAERFGLSQLHQLRGRVGRGNYQSYCILIANIKSTTTKKRMEIMVRSNDGFYIAEEDFKIRGSGDMFGLKQSGEDGLILSNLYEDIDVLKAANNEAKIVLADETKYVRIIDEIMRNLENSSKFICFN